jgi:ADP-L-glycero-D-manno-heptose 6-epimerase
MPESLRERYQYFTKASLNGLRSMGYNDDFTPIQEGVGDYVRTFLSRSDAYR